ncbi:MAG: hypothetical protein P8R42_19725 [Candidatus Binatia bacterium]|nr:hypothetical protein [Candidatus Binatia bacterium]
MMHQKGGSITTMLYTQRLDEACEAAQAAIDAADVLYKINGQAQILHDQGFALRATDPKKAYELCKKSYNHAAHKSKHLK